MSPKSLTQPLAQAKNGDKQFWKETFHATNAKAQGALIFFLLSFGFGGGRIFLIIFLMFSICSPSVFPIAPQFNPMVSLSFLFCWLCLGMQGYIVF
jgi:hypothetical protein